MIALFIGIVCLASGYCVGRLHRGLQALAATESRASRMFEFIECGDVVSCEAFGTTWYAPADVRSFLYWQPRSKPSEPHGDQEIHKQWNARKLEQRFIAAAMGEDGQRPALRAIGRAS